MHFAECGVVIASEFGVIARGKRQKKRGPGEASCSSKA